ncbi:MAG: universal stress protein, partial [Gaiellaceae bacterium]
LPGQTTFLGTMYSFGAMLSFTIAHAAVIGLRYRYRDEELVFRARPNLRFRGVDWPLFAIVGGAATAAAWLVVVVQEPETRWAGLGWLALGFIGYAIYRRRVLHQPLRTTVRAPVMVLGPSLTVEYRTIVVPVVRSEESEEALVAAARLAAERRATVAILHVIEVPLDLPLDVQLPDLEEDANEVLDNASAFVESYGVRTVARVLRARAAGPAIVEEADRRNAELIIIGAPRARPGRARIFGGTVDYVLKHAPTRVLIAAGRRAA